MDEPLQWLGFGANSEMLIRCEKTGVIQVVLEIIDSGTRQPHGRPAILLVTDTGEEASLLLKQLKEAAEEGNEQPADTSTE